MTRIFHFKWNKITIKTEKDFEDMVNLFNRIKPYVGGFDSETTGLHIILSKPFMFQFGFLHPTDKVGFSYVVDLQQLGELGMRIMRVWLQLAKTLVIYAAWNTKYDLHMKRNIGLVYDTENVTDVMSYVRYAHDALHVEEGGPPMAMKDYAYRYIDPHAKYHEKKLAQERAAQAKEFNLKLKQRLARLGVPDPKYKAKSYTLAVIKEMFKDPTFEISDLPQNVQAAYLDWIHFDLPPYLQEKVQSIIESDMIRYDMLNRDNLTEYAHYDIIYLLEILMRLEPVLTARGNRSAVDLENSLIHPLVEMECVGFKADVEYLETSRVNLKNYIRERRAIFYRMAGCELALGQHAKIKEILQDKYSLQINSTGSEELDLLVSNLQRNHENQEAIDFISVLQELRTLEKWYSAYIIRFQKELKHTDRLYTTINSVGTVSGRVTSDFQQFPKKAIKSIDGRELFHPRKIVIQSGNGYKATVYLDYSQIELRFQAMYTILVGDADLNLCRAYMPYKCINSLGVEFDYNNPAHIKAWGDDWFYQEEPTKKWTPTDVHGATTEKATGLSPDDPEFHSLRSTIGKRTNFAKLTVDKAS